MIKFIKKNPGNPPKMDCTYCIGVFTNNDTGANTPSRKSIYQREYGIRHQTI